MSKNRKIHAVGNICEKLDIPVGTLGKMSFIETAGNRELTVSGCEGLLTYSENRVILRLCDGAVTVCGDELELRSFAGGRIAVRGIIKCISYGEIGEVGDDT